jgi:hypothetical protein
VSRHDDLRLRHAHEQLVAAVGQLTTSEGWRRMLTVAARFHHYSPQNVLLITVQRPDATRVAGYRSWQQLGRQVRKGEHGIAILAPVTYRRSDSTDPSATADPNPDPGATGRIVRGFRVAHVFDIGQTDGPALPEVRPRLLTGDGDPALFAALTAQVHAAGYTFRREPCTHPDANGETSFADRVVRVRPDLAGAQAVKTLAHELAHVRLHDPKLDDGRVPREVAEVEAESVAFLVTTAHGLDSGDYTVPYVAGWAGGATGPLLSSAERVLSAAGQILDVAAAADSDRPTTPTPLVGLSRPSAIDSTPTVAAQVADAGRVVSR